jgi:tripeptidyl-peptidase I
MSVLFASGDQGVWGRTGVTANQQFHPDFPATSPYITAVGGTQFTVTGVVGSETTWADGGGGFSNVFPIPDYQSAQVAAYLANPAANLPNPSQFNSTGRAYPDVSALAGVANGYCVAAKGQFLKVRSRVRKPTPGSTKETRDQEALTSFCCAFFCSVQVGGTSAATPVFAGAVAMLNDALLKAGQQPMGFLNPWIYGVAGPAGVFNDVTSGTNNAGTGNGFTATKGWDPATGYGTPNYPAMLALVL